MKKSLIVIKPLGVAFPEDCIKSCWDNHNAIFGALAWNKDALKLEKVEFEKLRDVEEWVKEINEDWTAILHFGGRYPVKDAAMPYFKENVEGVNELIQALSLQVTDMHLRSQMKSLLV